MVVEFVGRGAIGEHILEGIHEEEQRPQTRRPVRIAIDKGPTVYRKRIREMIDAETVDHLGEPVAPVFLDAEI